LRTSGLAEPAYWRWLTLLFAVLWMLTLVVALKLKGRNRQEKQGNGGVFAVSENEAAILADLQQACKSGDRRGARQALQLWLRDFGPVENNRSLLRFAASTEDEAIRESIYTLDADGFQASTNDGQSEAWNGGVFWTHFQAWRSAHSARERANPPLTDLYAVENRPVR
jgi:hypothetical protein